MTTRTTVGFPDTPDDPPRATLFARLGVPPRAPWSMYFSSAGDAHPLQYLTGLSEAGLPVAVHVMVDQRTSPKGPLLPNGEANAIRVAPPRPPYVGMMI